jgi:fructose-1,6-bisphosphatase I
MASNGQRRILDIKPEGIHQRTPFMVGSKREMESLLDGRAK